MLKDNKASAGVMIFLIFAVIAIGAIVIHQFGLAALGSTDSGVNLTGTQYAAAYNSSVNTSVAAFEVVQFVPYLAGVIALVVMLLLLAKEFGK